VAPRSRITEGERGLVASPVVRLFSLNDLFIFLIISTGNVTSDRSNGQ
jgi:hypothetical protein